jgi:hypothetical protein
MTPTLCFCLCSVREGALTMFGIKAIYGGAPLWHQKCEPKWLSNRLITRFVFCASYYPNRWCFVQKQPRVLVLCNKSSNSWCYVTLGSRMISPKLRPKGSSWSAWRALKSSIKSDLIISQTDRTQLDQELYYVLSGKPPYSLHPQRTSRCV